MDGLIELLATILKVNKFPFTECSAAVVCGTKRNLVNVAHIDGNENPYNDDHDEAHCHVLKAQNMINNNFMCSKV